MHVIGKTKSEMIFLRNQCIIEHQWLCRQLPKTQTTAMILLVYESCLFGRVTIDLTVTLPNRHFLYIGD